MQCRIAFVLLALATVILGDFQTKLRIQKTTATKKASCPDPSIIPNQVRAFRMNKLLGSCEVYAGNTDSCKYRMSCCENTRGDMLCVRANRIKRRHRQAMRESQRVGAEPAVPAASSVAAVAVPPPKEEVIEMLNDETVAPVCPTLESLAAVGLDCTKAQKSYGFEAIQCNDDSDCKSNDLLLPPTTKRICCADPCIPASEGVLKLCLTDAKELQKEANAPPKAAPSVQLDYTSDTSNDGVKVNRKCPNPYDDICKDPATCTSDYSITCDNLDLYNKTNPTCNDDKGDKDCATGRICCTDPCENAKGSRCFDDFTPVPKIQLPKVQIVGMTEKEDAPPPVVPVGGMVNDAVEPLAVSSKAAVVDLQCPKAPADGGCLAWANATCTNITGKPEIGCKDGTICCDLSPPNCQDEYQYCVKPVPMHEFPGCPVPSYLAAKGDLETCQKGDVCKNGGKCCPVDVQGQTDRYSWACVKP